MLKIRITRFALTIGSTLIGEEVYSRYWSSRTHTISFDEAAEKEFNTSSRYPVPEGCNLSRWKIRNDYPSSPPPLYSDAPWANIDFKRRPERFMEVVKLYALEGNKESDFIVQRNKKRDWYHAPWMHYSKFGREPLRGFAFERPIPPLELARTQTEEIQTWAVAFYNATEAALLHDMWRNPAKPAWDKDLLFEPGGMAFKLVVANATKEEIPTLKDAPHWEAVIAQQRDNGVPIFEQNPDIIRNDYTSTVRLVQLDFSIRDVRAPVGWVFGTFMYDGSRTEKDPWDRLTPVALQWGNDPDMNQEAWESGQRPKEGWVNPRATKLLARLGGNRPSFGWNDRANGAADNFITSCLSCHSCAERPMPGQKPVDIAPPPPIKVGQHKYIPIDDAVTMRWFRNIPAGKPFTPGAFSADYNLRVMMGWNNYEQWVEDNRQRGILGSFGKAISNGLTTRRDFPLPSPRAGGPTHTDVKSIVRSDTQRRR